MTVWNRYYCGCDIDRGHFWLCKVFIIFFFRGIFYFCSTLLYSTMLHLPPPRENSVERYWDRTQDSFVFGIGCQRSFTVFWYPKPRKSLYFFTIKDPDIIFLCTSDPAINEKSITFKWELSISSNWKRVLSGYRNKVDGSTDIQITFLDIQIE